MRKRLGEFRLFARAFGGDCSLALCLLSLQTFGCKGNALALAGEDFSPHVLDLLLVPGDDGDEGGGPEGDEP